MAGKVRFGHFAVKVNFTIFTQNILIRHLKKTSELLKTEYFVRVFAGGGSKRFVVRE
jgi:hypothetical protein